MEHGTSSVERRILFHVPIPWKWAWSQRDPALSENVDINFVSEELESQLISSAILDKLPKSFASFQKSWSWLDHLELAL